MKVIGLTGGIGSGKSMVASVFQRLEIPVYDSDQRAKDLYHERKDLKAKMILVFGPDVYVNDQINRAFLANIVFSDKSKLQKLNAIVHPLIHLDFEDWKSDQSAPYVIREAAILIESEAYKTCDAVIVVSASEEVRLQRVVLRDSALALDVRKRINNQITDEERLVHADFVIDNNGDNSIIEQVMLIHQKLMEI